MPFSALSLFHVASLLFAAAAAVGTFRFVPETSPFDAAFTGLSVLLLGVLAGEGAARRLERRLLLRRLAEERESREAQAEAIQALTAEFAELRQLRDHGDLLAEMRLVRSQLSRLEGNGRSRGAEPPDAGPVRLEGEALLRAVEGALKENRVDVYLQPVVQLPQRKPVFYECLARLRDAENRLIEPHQYLRLAEAGGFIDSIDNLSLFRCVQSLKRRRPETLDIGFFCNLSSTTLDDADFFDQFVEFLAANRDLAGRLVFELEAERLLDANPRVREHIESLRRLDFRISADNIASSAIDLFELARRGVAFAKVDVGVLLHRTPEALPLPVLRDELRAAGLTLIAAKVETEEQALELIDSDVRLAQGFLFGEPRRMRPDA